MALTLPDARYEPRQRGTDLLYRVIEGHLESFLSDADAAGKVVPGFVREAFWDYLDCGIPQRGFAILRCPDCDRARLVKFSCKNRGFCPSCLGRRMCQTSAHLVDRVLPHVPVRQWVLSLPIPLRFLLGRDAEVRSAVLKVFLGVVFRWYEKRAEADGARRGQTGAVVMAQSFGSSLNCNLHFHALVLDGTFAEDENGSVAFHPTRPPSTDEVTQLVELVHHRIERLLLRRGLHVEEAELADSDDAQLLMQQASLSGRVALGTRAGRKPRALVGPPREDAPLPVRCARSGWYSLHAGVRIAAQDRPALERLVRYILRPPLSHNRLSLREDGMLVLRLKTAWTNGTTALLLSGSELLQRLAAIVPRPRSHLLTYHGILGGHARLRKNVVPTPPEEPERGCLHTERSAPSGAASKGLSRWIPWAQLLFRAFGVEAMRCDCGAWMEVHAIVIGRPATERALASLSPSLIRSRAPPAVDAAVA